MRKAVKALGAVITVMVCGPSPFGIATEAPDAAHPAVLPEVEHILRQAGASTADIAWVDDNELQGASAEGVTQYADWLKRQTSAELDIIVKHIRSDSQYRLGPDSEEQAGVPKGQTLEFVLADSKIFPGFHHSWWLYVPDQDKSGDGMPLALMVFLDGGSFLSRHGHWRVPVVLDNLISRHQLPVMAAVFIDPGVSIATENGQPIQSNRSVEYDTLDGNFARFLAVEILPVVRKHVRIVADAAGRGICGCSSGGIASFTAAWQRPDQFRKVISFSGSFTNLRGGEVYPDLVRRRNPKPIRVFQHIGTNDLVFGGLPTWFEQNNLMSAALNEKHYDHKYVVDQGSHCSVGAASILPDALRWTWRDYPR